MNDEVSDRTVRVAVESVKLSVRAMMRGLYYWKSDYDRGQLRANENTPSGKQTVKELIGQGQGVSSIEAGDVGVRDFKRIANKYGVDFAIVKDKDVDPPRYTVFFKAKDADAITQVLKECVSKQTKKKENEIQGRSSLLQKLKKYKEKVASMPKKVKEKRKEFTR